MDGGMLVSFTALTLTDGDLALLEEIGDYRSRLR